MSRLSEILGVEEGQKFGFDILDCKMSNNGRVIDYYENGNWHLLYDATIICEMINNPEKIKIILTKPKLTEQQLIAIRGRVAEGWNYIVSEDGWKYCYKEKPWNDDKKSDYFTKRLERSLANETVFDFVKEGECVYLPDLIGGKDE